MVRIMNNINKLNSTRPEHKDKYFVDTNVWFWFTYCSSREIETPNKPQRYQTKSYPEFIEKALDSGAKLFHCPLAFSELANVIERTEHDIYIRNNMEKKISRKKFRSIPEERQRVLSEIKVAWDTICSLSTCINVNLRLEMVKSAQMLLEQSTLDPYDAFYYQVMTSEGISKIITDDCDFKSVAAIEIYTANAQIGA